ncbi:hypothetical protein ElyMa_003050100 [Elysia marginata]|uniref:Uncharacterized protein n=1 Tax=Elysia marginata TaxID=1093978 RepID=A0AAV4IMI6_9GAST|nr:hypothetical protein ElyMa_003050100 [Elysia marginata]
MSYSFTTKGRSHGGSSKSTSSTNGDDPVGHLTSPTIGSPVPVFPPSENGSGGRGGSEPPGGQHSSSAAAATSAAGSSAGGGGGHRGSVVSVVSMQHPPHYPHHHHKSGRSSGGGGMFSPGVRRHSKGYRDGVGTKLSIVGRSGPMKWVPSFQSLVSRVL